jgi:hypothetical protein
MAEVAHHVVTQVGTHLPGIPARAVQQALHPIRCGVPGRLASANCQLFFRSIGASNPSKYARACRRGSTLPNRPATARTARPARKPTPEDHQVLTHQACAHTTDHKAWL